MPTTKKRFNITLDHDTEQRVNLLAKHKNQPKSAIIASLTREALELQEDIVLAELAEERMRNHDGRWLSHEEVWGK